MKKILNNLKQKFDSFFHSDFPEDFDVYVFALSYYNNSERYSNYTMPSKGMYMEKSNISYLNDWFNYESTHGRQAPENITELLQKNLMKISKLRGHPTIAYIADITNRYPQEEISISKSDIENIVNLIQDIPNDTKEIDVIIQSLGGSTFFTSEIISLLQNRFENVNFLIPSKAYSAATLLCMSGNGIVITPEGSMGPYDIILKTDNDENGSSAKLKLERAIAAKKEFEKRRKEKLKSERIAIKNGFNDSSKIKMPPGLYEDWDEEDINITIHMAKESRKFIVNHATFYLLKYMFKSKKYKQYSFSTFHKRPFWKNINKDYFKAKNIVKFFVEYGEIYSHDAPITYEHIHSTGLNINLAEDGLLELLRETANLSNRFFDRSIVTKLFVNSDYYTFSKTKGGN